ncbi:hypothetical protein NE237_013714 [Protea cynaroides]|uniref:DUF913 domain-containing protein n=1 Tax=Protea cynaroides TaxID=273540 RepID=A0A9Q0GZ77_9MAGN|nr:hypothetical protein NE237_013714 [Protea cynaroides]
MVLVNFGFKFSLQHAFGFVISATNLYSRHPQLSNCCHSPLSSLSCPWVHCFVLHVTCPYRKGFWWWSVLTCSNSDERSHSQRSYLFSCLDAADLPSAFLDAIMGGILSSAKAVSCIPHCLDALCLNNNGLQAVRIVMLYTHYIYMSQKGLLVWKWFPTLQLFRK